MTECAVKSVTPACTTETWPTLLGNGSQPQGASDAFTASLCHTAPRLEVCWTAFRPSSTTAARIWPRPGLSSANCRVQAPPDFQRLAPSASDLGSALGACKYLVCDSELPTTSARCTAQRFNAQAFWRFGNGARKGGEDGSRCPGVQVSRCPLPRDAQRCPSLCPQALTVRFARWTMVLKEAD
jgi:hypothetical protein